MNFSGVNVCVVMPVVFPDTKFLSLGFELDGLLKKQGAVVFAPNGSCAQVDRVDRIRQLINVVTASRVLMLLPGWGNCTFSRAAWSAAQYLQINIIFVDRDANGDLIFPSENGVLSPSVHEHKAVSASGATGVLA